MTAEEKLAEAQFSQLVVPAHWKFKGYDRPQDKQGNMLSIGRVYEDTQKTGFDATFYKLFILYGSDKLGICIKTIDANGKPKYYTGYYNKPISEVNDYIETTYGT